MCLSCRNNLAFVLKILRSLPARYEFRKHAIMEGNNLQILSRNTLVGKLKIFDHEMQSKDGKDIAFNALKNTETLKSESVDNSVNNIVDPEFSNEDLYNSVS